MIKQAISIDAKAHAVAKLAPDYKLLPHQQRVVDKMNNPEVRGVLAPMKSIASDAAELAGRKLVPALTA